MGRLRYGVVPAIWLAVMWALSTSYFTSDHTVVWFLPLLHWLFPQATHPRLLFYHLLIRKTGHVLTYLILSLLLVRAIRCGRPRWQFGWAASAWAIAAGYAVMDEFHQAFVPGRGASPRDVLLDSAAAALGQVIAWLWWRRRGAARERA